MFTVNNLPILGYTFTPLSSEFYFPANLEFGPMARSNPWQMATMMLVILNSRP